MRFKSKSWTVSCALAFLIGSSFFFANKGYAFEETLTARKNASTGHIEAVINGRASAACGEDEQALFYPATSIVVQANVIVVSSPYKPAGCQGAALVPYQVVADLGILAPSTYTLSWSVVAPGVPDPARTLSIVFSAADPDFVHAAPTLDARLLFLLASLFFAIGVIRSSGERAKDS